MTVEPYHHVYPGDREAIDTLRRLLIDALNRHTRERRVKTGTILIAVSEMVGIVVGTLTDEFGMRAPESEQGEFKASVIAMITEHIEIAEAESMKMEE